MEIEAKRAGLSAERLAWIGDHLDRSYIQSGKIAGCQVLVARHGHVAYQESLGLMDRERNRPMRDDTIFRIFSMTKPITSIALMTLYERGLFQIDDPVGKFIPSWRDKRVYVSGEGESMETREPDRPMTMRHILSHTSGLSHGMTQHPVDRLYGGRQVLRGGNATLAGLADRLADVPLHFSPGERWMYGYSTDICAYLVEVISGMPFDRFLQQTIFDPLRMKDTAFYVPDEKLERFAANYLRQPDKTLRLVADPMASGRQPPTFLSGGGGLTSTSADYFRFCEMLRRGGELDGARIIGSRTLRLMTQNHLAGGQDLTTMARGPFSETAYEGVGFGLGFATTLDSVAAGMPGQGDFYWGGLASTIFWVDPQEDLEVIFMTQLMPSTSFNFRGQIKSIVYGAIED